MVSNEYMLQCTSYAKDIAHDVSTGSMRGGEETCGSGEGGRGDGAGCGACRGCEWGGGPDLLHAACDARVHHRTAGQHVFPVQVMPDVKVTLVDRVVFVRSLQGRAGACYATLRTSSR